MENVVKEESKNKNLIIGVLVFVIVLLLAALVYFVFIKKDEPQDNQQVDNNNQEKDLSEKELTIYEYNYEYGKSLHKSADTSPSNTYKYNCFSDNCKEYDDFYPYVLIGDGDTLNIYNVLTKEKIKTNMDNNEKIDDNTKFAYTYDNVTSKSTLYGVYYINDNTSGFYNLNDKKIYYLNKKYDNLSIQTDFIDDHIWADYKYLINYKTGKLLHEFDEPEGYGFVSVVGNGKNYYYTEGYDGEMWVRYTKLYDKNFNVIFKADGEEYFNIDGIDETGKINLSYNSSYYKLDNTGNKTLIKQFDKSIKVIGFNYDNQNAVIVKDKKILLIDKDNRALKTIGDEPKGKDGKACYYGGPKVYFKEESGNQMVIVDWGCEMGLDTGYYSKVFTYNITKNTIQTKNENPAS